MRIRAFSYFVSQNMQKINLNDTVVVIDGHYYFYALYGNSTIPYVFGSESDRYVDYIRKDLMKFKNANVKCYFVFKGTTDVEKTLSKTSAHGKDYVVGSQNDVLEPIFVKEICLQVLKDMEFDYVLCQGDHKTNCIALAQQFSCPLISFDIEYCFAGVDYIPYKSYVTRKYDTYFIYNERTKSLECEIFRLGDFLESFKLTKEKLATFVVLTDDYIFPKNFFDDFFASEKIPLLPTFRKIQSLLFWCYKNSEEQLIQTIFQFISVKHQEEFVKAKEEIETKICQKQAGGGIPILFFTNRNDVEITEKDPFWFDKGIAFGYIVKSFIDVYKYKTVVASNFIEDYDQENSIVICLDIIKYAYDLLTNFTGGEIYLRHLKNMSGPIQEDSVINYSIAKPEYDAIDCVFENGWRNIRSLNLFHHFIQETLQLFDFSKLDRAPKDARLLIIALVYFARRNTNETKDEINSIMLSYVMLSAVFDKTPVNYRVTETNGTKRYILDPTVDQESLTVDDCKLARSILADFFTVTNHELFSIFDRKILHSLVQFQHILNQLNNLNTLCGEPYEPTKYHKTYNGTFVYKVLRFIKVHGSESIKKKINPAPSVLALFTGMIEVFEQVMY